MKTWPPPPKRFSLLLIRPVFAAQGIRTHVLQHRSVTVTLPTDDRVLTLPPLHLGAAKAGRNHDQVNPSEYWINWRASWVSSALPFIGGVNIGIRAKHVLNLIWFGCIPTGRRGVISSFKWFLPAFPRVEKGVGVGVDSTPVVNPLPQVKDSLPPHFYRRAI